MKSIQFDARMKIYEKIRRLSPMRVLAIFLVLCLSFSFVTAAAENILNDAIQSNKIIESKIDISKYTESKNYHVEKIIPTEYGTVLYFWPVGAPHGGKS